jgi:hypothetical protein
MRIADFGLRIVDCGMEILPSSQTLPADRLDPILPSPHHSIIPLFQPSNSGVPSYYNPDNPEIEQKEPEQLPWNKPAPE